MATLSLDLASSSHRPVDRRGLLRSGLGSRPGPVTLAIQVMRREEPPMSPEWEAELAAGRAALDSLRNRAEEQVCCDHPPTSDEWDAALLEAASLELRIDLTALLNEAAAS